MVQGRFGVPREDGVLGHRHDVSDVRFSVQEIEQGGCREAAVEAHQEIGARKRAAWQGQQPSQDAEWA